MRLIVFAGLPGTGKSTIAEAVGRLLPAPVFALDWLLGALTPFHILTRDNAAPIGDALLMMLVRRQLLLGQSAIVDSPTHTNALRQQWRQLAAEFGTEIRFIETVCPDTDLHHARIEGRVRGIPGWHELTWAHVERLQAVYEPWHSERLVLDTTQTLEENIKATIVYIQ